MKRYLIYIFLLMLTACSSNEHRRYDENADAQKTYVQLINLLEQGSRAEMPEELMQKIFFVYDKKLLFNSGPNEMNPFMKCVKVHKDLLKIMKNTSADAVQNFKYFQNEFLQELRLLKTRNLTDGEQFSASRLIEAAYIKFLLFHFSQCKDFYDLLILEAIRKNSFSPAVAIALRLEIYGISSLADIEIPDVYILPTKNTSEKVLLMCLIKCCGTVIVETVFFDEAGVATKLGLTGNCFSSPMVEEKSIKPAFPSARFVILQAANSFFGWNGRDKLLLKSDIKEVGIESFWLDYKQKRWIRAWVHPEDILLFNKTPD
jgi:hypothetical protein